VADTVQDSPAVDAVDDEAVADGEETLKLDLKVEAESVGPCRKHVRITVTREDIERVASEQVGKLSSEAAIPGFRPGHIPETLLRKRFRKELAEQVKQRVLMLSLQQLAVETEIEPIDEPEIDVEGLELPETGDFSYEFDVEVRPNFELPEYRGMTIERPTREIGDQDVDEYLLNYLEQYAQLAPVDAPAAAGDTVIVDAEFTHQGKPLRSLQELPLRVRPTVRFFDADIAGFDQLMIGARADDVREVDLTISMEASTIEMRGETVHAKFTVLDVKRPEMPELNAAFLERIGVDSEEQLREQIRSSLERQVRYEQRQATRDQVLRNITASANWDLPEDLVRKQVENAMRREILELQQAGFTREQIQAREAELRQSSLTTTRRNLKQHFILDRIADQESIEVTEGDIELQVYVMARQSGENPRRVRSRLVKTGQIENLFAQIREMKAVDLVIESAKIVDKPLQRPVGRDIEAVKQAVCASLPDTAVSVADEEAADE